MTAETPRLPSEIDAHLMVAAIEGVCTVLVREAVRVRGHFELPDDFAEVGYVADVGRDQLRRWAPGDRVTAQYHLGAQPFQFVTRIKARSAEGRLRLDRPRSVSSAERRIVPRVTVDADQHLILRTAEQLLKVVDLSNQGARVRWPGAAPAVGHRVAAGLEGALDSPIAVDLEVRRVQDGWVGLAFRDMRTADCWRLSQALYRQSHVVDHSLRPRAAG